MLQRAYLRLHNHFSTYRKEMHAAVRRIAAGFEGAFLYSQKAPVFFIISVYPSACLYISVLDYVALSWVGSD
jgi:hypothetical protein